MNRAGEVSGSRILTLIGLVLLTVITLNVNGATRIFTWPWWCLWRLVLFVPIVLWLAPGDLSANVRLDARARVLLGAFLGWYVLAALTSSHVATSISYAITMVAMVALTVVVARWPAALRQVPLVLAVGGVVYAAASLAVWWWLIATPYWRDTAALNIAAGAPVFEVLTFGPRNSLLLGHWNYTAGVAVLTLPWVVAEAWRARGLRRGVWGVGALIVFGAIFTAMSRGAWLGVAAAGGFAVLTVVARSQWSSRRLGFAAVIVGVAAVGATLLIPRLRITAMAVFTGHGFTASDVQRINMVEVGGLMVRDHPGLGQGPGLTPRQYPAYRHKVDGGVETAFQLHSTPLQLAVDAGLGAAALAGALVLLALGRCFQELRSHATPPAARRVAGISLAGYAVFSLTDHQLDVPVIAAAVGAVFGLLLQGTGEEAATKRWPAVVVGGIVLLGLIGLTVREGQGRKLLAEGIADVEKTGSTSRLDEAAFRAAEWQGDDPQPLVAAAVVHQRRSHVTNDPAESARHRGAARHLYRLALEREPDLEIAHFNLGWLELRSQPENAAAHFRRALELAPDRRGVFFGLGLARLEAGDQQRAVTGFALELLHDPLFAVSPRWDAPALQDLRAPALRRARVVADELAGRIPHGARESLQYVASLLGWMLDAAETVPVVGAPAEAEAAVAALGGSMAGDVASVTETTVACQVLATAARNPDQRPTLIRQLLFSRLYREPTLAETDAVAKLVERYGTDWRAWILAPEGREAPWVHAERSHRPAYATLAYNLDIPTPFDEYVAQDNRLVRWFWGELFPAKGHLPASAVVTYIRDQEL